MKIRSPLLIYLLSSTLLSSLFGCAFLSGKKTSGSAASKKFSAASEDENSIPADIAYDIALIKSGGTIAPSKSWSAAAPASNLETPAAAGLETPVAAVEEVSTPDGVPNSAEEAAIEPNRMPAADGVAEAPVKMDGPAEKYTIQKGDTLMHIAFAKYGNVYRWRDIYNANRNLIADFNRPIPGTIISIYGVKYFVLEKNGEPYLIRWGDTLGKLSQKFYGSSDYWRGLWKNNSRLIRNPDQIYAGFTLYYPSLEKLPKD